MHKRQPGVRSYNRLIILILLFLIITVFLTYKMSSFLAEKDSDKLNWRGTEFIDIPKDITKLSLSINVKEEMISLDISGKTVKVFTREAQPSSVHKIDLLLLHGAAFSSKTWYDLATIQLFAGLGFRVLAVDLPGFGQSKDAKVDSKADFITALVKHFSLRKPTIVSPSMSGGFSLPFIFGGGDISGFVPVAPVGTSSYASKFKDLKVPTAIIYGELDTNLGISSLENLRHIPISQIYMLKAAKHPAYLDQPQEFHNILYNFLLAVDKTIKSK